MRVVNIQYAAGYHGLARGYLLRSGPEHILVENVFRLHARNGERTNVDWKGSDGNTEWFILRLFGHVNMKAEDILCGRIRMSSLVKKKTPA